MERILVVTYDLDFPQLRLMAHCLNKNWQGNKDLLVVCGSSGKDADIIDCVNAAQTIVESELPNWKIAVVAGSMLSGYAGLQINKVVYSSATDVTDTINIDSKDFLLKPSNLSDYKQQELYRVPYIHHGLFDEYYPEVKNFIPQVNDQTPNTLILTPWIWKNDQVKKYLGALEKQYGSYEQWQHFPIFADWAAFFAFTYYDQTSTMQFIGNEYTWCPSQGIWTNQSYEGAIESQKIFDQWDVHKFWKHSRKITDPRCLNVTIEVLRKYGIADNVINKWVKENQELVAYFKS